MSSTKRPREATPTATASKKPRTITRRVAADPSSSKVLASRIHLSSAGRIGRKKIEVDRGKSSPKAAEGTPGPSTPDLRDIFDESLASYLFEGPAGPAGEPEDPQGEKPRPKKRRTNTTSSKLQEWLQFREVYLLELLRGYGLGDHHQTQKCATCHMKDGKFRCLDCYLRCPLRCASCLVDNHRENPLHHIEEWNGTFFEKQCLKALGLRVQLGHGGQACPCPLAGPSDFVVMHVNGFHRVTVDFCDCGSLEQRSPHPRVQLLRMGWFPATFERPKTAFTFDVLKLFHKITLQGKTTLYNFYHAILQVTDGLKLERTTDRYPEFLLVFRVWRHLQALKYAGRGHDPAGAAATLQGELVLECPACPHPGKNLPENWENAKPEDLFLYTLFLAIDANFKLKQKDRGIKDIELGPGWGCYVESSRYEKHVAGYQDQPEINACSSDHNAIARANTSVPGYIINGVGLGLCSRHSIIRGNGVVDLPKGEKYCSMDYAVLSILITVLVLRVVLSYDIGCQWRKNFRERMLGYDEDLHISDDMEVEIGIPNWHGIGHGLYCRINYCLNYLLGVSRTCGEDVEITWSSTNSLAPSTREMGSGARRETLNDHWNGWNFRKIVGFRTLFLKRFKDACMMHKKHKEAFDTFSSTFKAKTISIWTKMVEDWLKDLTKPNPYEEPQNSTTLQEVRLELAKEDAEAVKEGKPMPHKISLTECLVKGLELEKQQRTLKYDVAQTKGKLSTKQSADLQEKCNGLSRRIQQWRDAQLTYMPAVGSLLIRRASSATVEVENGSYALELAEDIPLFLPSSVPASLRDSMKTVATKELRLRKAQAEEALEDICRGRRMITGLTQFKKLNICGAGNKPNTRMRTLYNRLQRRIKRAANRYQAAWEALNQLEPGGGTWKDRYRQLDPTKDIRGPGKQPDDPQYMPNGRFEQSWIWLVGHSEGRETTEEEFDDIMRAEWAKMRARRDRWEEEYRLVIEEMRRTVDYLKWKAAWWRSQAYRHNSLDPVTCQGVTAYAERQAQMLESLAMSCVGKWSPALSQAGVVVEWAIQIKDDGLAADSKMGKAELKSSNEEGEWLDDEDEGGEEAEGEEEGEENIFDSYDIED